MGTEARPAARRASARKSGESRRREIADAALRVIAEQGLGRFTAMAIANEVGLTDGALFRHFPTKEAIVLAAVGRLEELLLEGFPPGDEDPLERLGVFFRRRVAAVHRHPGIGRLVVSDELARAAPPEGAERVARLRRRAAAFVADCLGEAARRGLLRPGLAADVAGLIVLGALMALNHGPGLPGVPALRAAERVWRALEEFLRGDRAVRPRPGRRSRGRSPATGP